MNFKEFFKERVLRIENASFLLIALPYLGANLISLSDSPFFSYANLALLLLALIAIELISKWSIHTFNTYEKLLSLLLVTISIEFFYGFALNIPLHTITQKLFSVDLREKILLVIALVFIVGLQLIFTRKKLSYKALNIFLLILTIIAIITSISKKPSQAVPLDSIQSNYQSITHGPQKNKPVILIIVDEYNSPDNLFELTKDSSIYSFNNWLKEKSWQTKTTAYSNELSTIHSMSSLFNFNLSLQKTYSAQSEEKIVVGKLYHAVLADSLANKGVTVYNYGIFDLGNTKPKSRLYLYPRNFIEAFLLHSTYLAEKTKTGSFQTKYLKNPPSYISDHNKDILNHLPSKLEEEKLPNKTFVYVHLYMPHNPFSLAPEFTNPETDNFKRYVAFWKFTNQKLEALLTELNKENKYRIILTGDHGLRESITNPHESFSAYYGFEGYDLNKIRSVQDIGSLINSAY
jgi:Sulfatase